ncbi:fungal-specific transcription factor domain-containing protein [Xylogone sp. PMI_703]|nr:fungal-specific transcription factor domain-containing protein [Xylogone sp. PMI_703]
MDPHGFAQQQQQSLSPSDYFNGLELTPPIPPGPRSYKSRKYRPCDFCRARQVACNIIVAPPCALCSSHGRQCTFVERPKKKRRPNATIVVDDGSGNVNVNGNGGSNANGSANGGAGMRHGSTSDGMGQVVDLAAPQQYNPSTTQLSPNFMAQYNGHQFDGQTGHDGQYNSHSSPDQPQHMGGIQDVSPYSMDPYSQMVSMPGVRIRSLDSQSCRSSRFIGETGESNPYLLRHYHYDQNDECTISKVTYRRIPTSSSTQNNEFQNDKGDPPVVFMLADDSLARKGEPRVEDDVFTKAREDIASMFTEAEALRLIGLYFRFIHPYFPILAKSSFYSMGILSPAVLHTLPLSLLSAMYATALPFVLYDDLLATTIVHSPPPAAQLFRISWLAVTQELHTPGLATLQACLLLLQRAPTNRYATDTPWKTSLVGWTVSLAHTLGLTRECGDWISVPTWELSLRKRLWYGVFIMDKWASLGAGMPSHVRDDDFDVLPLTEADFEPDTNGNDPTNHSNIMPQMLGEPDVDAHFRLLVELTFILGDIMESFYTLRSSRRTSKDFTLSLDLARPLRTRLKAWNDSLPPSLSLHRPDRLDSRGMAQLSGNSSLNLAYIVATMTLFRALMRPLENLSSVEEEDRGIVGSRVAVRAGAKECAKEVVEFVENLGRGALDAFWHSWSRANFAIASSFLMQLLVTAESEAESAEINELVSRWRWAMRVGSSSSGSGLMSLGLLRLDGLMLENGSGGGSSGAMVPNGVQVGGAGAIGQMAQHQRHPAGHPHGGPPGAHGQGGGSMSS